MKKPFIPEDDMKRLRRPHLKPVRSAWIGVAAVLAALLSAAAAMAQSGPAAGPTITVTGTAEVAATPDRATVSLGAVVEHKQAQEAQKQIAQIMERVIKDVRAQGIPEDKIRTVGLSLNPVYSHPSPRAGQEPEAPRIVAYRAANTLRVLVDDLQRVGGVIDAGIAAGANQLGSLTFDLRDDLKYRNQALQLAAQEARAKAEAIASALSLQLGEVLEIREEGAPAAYPLERRMAAPAAAGTPIQPGQVQVGAGVSLRLRLIGPQK
jgi:uncharacterized protein YggE